jgi:hypothetical protein
LTAFLRGLPERRRRSSQAEQLSSIPAGNLVYRNALDAFRLVYRNALTSFLLVYRNALTAFLLRRGVGDERRYCKCEDDIAHECVETWH